MLTSAVANAAAAAAAAGAGKKAALVQLQAELASDDEWNKFIARDGLLVVDVYTEWCGPCLGMVGNLKKLKLELGGDNLHLAVAKSDTIKCLKRFRNRSEPTWMFIAAGQLVNVIFGANAPLIARTIEQELKNEELARRGERERPVRAPHELTPPEQEIATAQQKLEEARLEREAAALAAARAARRAARAQLLETYFMDACPALLLPHAQKHVRKVADALEPYGVTIADKCPLVMNKTDARLLSIEDPELTDALTVLTERPSLVLLLKKLPEREGDVIELTRRALFGEGVEEDPPKKSLAEELQADVPGLFVPADRDQRAAGMDILFPKMVGTVADPPQPVDPPHIAMVFGAWQRRAVLCAATSPALASRLLRYGFFADAGLEAPRLLCKTVDQYEDRTEKDYCETIVLMLSVGVVEPALAACAPPPCPPDELRLLGPLHVSADAVEGEHECAKFFPPGYSEPEVRVKPKTKKRKKKRTEAKEEIAERADSTTEVAAEAEADAPQDDDAEDDADAEGEGEGEGDAEEEDTHADKATSPPPPTPH